MLSAWGNVMDRVSWLQQSLGFRKTFFLSRQDILRRVNIDIDTKLSIAISWLARADLIEDVLTDLSHFDITIRCSFYARAICIALFARLILPTPPTQ